MLNVEAENEHFEISDSVISWIEAYNATKNINGIIDDDRSDMLREILPPPSTHHQLSAPGMAWNLVKIFSEKQGILEDSLPLPPSQTTTEPGHTHHDNNQTHTTPLKKSPSPLSSPEVSNSTDNTNSLANQLTEARDQDPNALVRMRGNDEWAPPRAQIIFNIHEEANFRKLMQRQNYRCAGCGTKIDLELARRLVLYCHYLGKYFCKCCFSHKAIHLPGYILQKWDFHKYPVSHFALQLLDRIANEPLFNIDDINPSLYRRVKKLRHLVDIRMQLYFLKIYISTCTQTDKLNGEYTSFTHQHLLQDDIHLYSLNNLIEIQHGKLYEYLNDLVTRSISHIAQCNRCRAKGHYCQLCGPSSFMSSIVLNSHSSQTSEQSKDSQSRLKHSNSIGQNISATGHQATTAVVGAVVSATTAATTSPVLDDHELIFPFEIGRVAQCRACGCCFHLQCFVDAGRNCPKCERIQRRMNDNVAE